MSAFTNCKYLPGGETGGIQCITKLNDCNNCNFKYPWLNEIKDRCYDEKIRCEKKMSRYALFINLLIVVPCALLALLLTVVPTHIIGPDWTSGMEFLLSNYRTEFTVFIFVIIPFLLFLAIKLDQRLCKLFEIDRVKGDPYIFQKYRDINNAHFYGFVMDALIFGLFIIWIF